MSRLWVFSLISLSVSMSVGVTCGCRQEPINSDHLWQTVLKRTELDEQEFTTIFADRVAEEIPDAKVSVEAPLQIVVDLEVGKSTCNLSNAWRDCRDDVIARPEIVNQHLETLKSTIARLMNKGPLDLREVVPLIKSKQWVAEANEQGLAVYCEQLAGDVFVIYAEDGTDQLRFIDDVEYAEFKLSTEEIRATAIANLRRRLPKIERYGKGPLYMLAAGGTFESSLLLLSDVWADLDEAVDGRVVVAVPSRDLLMFTGENAREAIQQMRDTVAKIHQDGNYLISKELLIRSSGRWEKLPDRNEVPKLRH